MGTTDDAAASLHDLAAHYRQHPVTGAAGHSYIAAGPRATRTVPAAPLDLDMIDHIDASVREIADHARQVNPDADPLPARVKDAYGWYMETTALAPVAEQQRRDTIVYRQHLEHAIRLGDIKIVRPHRCPKCRTLGLMWDRVQRTVVCTNGNCLTRDGLSRKFTLAQLAYEHVAAQYENSVRDCAT